ncbi:hypothetical protein HMPREF1551_02378 [Capnocytophaga sp. oral taxon 863 str. F0517]|nr:hypothetical protein HMPREF1551_02378 [Capnocytophaga sp. oral taxon 863 str. F0517]
MFPPNKNKNFYQEKNNGLICFISKNKTVTLPHLLTEDRFD